jgi:putative hemolysin
MVNSVILALGIIICICLGAFFSGTETGLYQLSRLRLRLGVEKKRLSFVVLGKCLSDSSGLLLSLLVGNNLANYLTTSIVAAVLLDKIGTERSAELFTTLFTAPILFVFSELIPKNIFFYRADTLMPHLSVFLYTFHKILSYSGIVPLLKFISVMFSRAAGLSVTSRTVMTSVQRHKFQAILRDTREEGILSPVQNDIINRLISISQIQVRSVMTPINKTETVKFDSDRPALINKLKKCAFTRLPVLKDNSGDIEGFINIYEVLCSSKQFDSIENFIKPIRKIDVKTSVTDAINIMQKENHKMVLAVRIGHVGRGRAAGIVTMKDLVEELLGELEEW